MAEKELTAPHADMGVVGIDYEIHCNGEFAACANSWKEIQRYALQYSEDGPIEIYEVTRAPVIRALLANKGEK